MLIIIIIKLPNVIDAGKAACKQAKHVVLSLPAFRILLCYEIDDACCSQACATEFGSFGGVSKRLRPRLALPAAAAATAAAAAAAAPSTTQWFMKPSWSANCDGQVAVHCSWVRQLSSVAVNCSMLRLQTPQPLEAALSRALSAARELLVACSLCCLTVWHTVCWQHLCRGAAVLHYCL
jgi:hypothetical protein